MSFLFYLFLFLFLFLCVILVLVIMSQESKNMGLGSAFGGNVSNSLFGTSTADVLKKFTGYLILLFMVSSLILSIWSESLVRVKQRSLPTVIEEVNE